MKKLKGIKKLLSREEMKLIQGGSGGGHTQCRPTGSVCCDDFPCCAGTCMKSGYWGVCR